MKAWTIAVKDVSIRFRDRAALALMLAAPLAITLMIGLAFGGIGGGNGSSGIARFDVQVYNADQGRLGQVFVDCVLKSERLKDLVNPIMAADEAAARAAVDAGQVAAAIIIPPDFTANATADGGRQTTDNNPPPAVRRPSSVVVYVDPASQINSAIVRGLAESFTNAVAGQSIAIRVSIEQAAQVSALAAFQLGQEVQQQFADMGSSGDLCAQAAEETVEGQLTAPQLITLKSTDVQTRAFNVLDYFAPSMMIYFVMFTAAGSARSILTEQQEGTLARLFTTPTGRAEILGGKLIGGFVSCLLQIAILVAATALVFRVNWGQPLPLLALVLASVAAFTSLGLALGAFARTPQQAGAMQSAVITVLGLVGGNFYPRFLLPDWMRTLGLITPNAWAMDGFTRLAQGGGLGDIGPYLAALLAFGVVLFSVGITGLRRRLG